MCDVYLLPLETLSVGRKVNSLSDEMTSNQQLGNNIDRIIESHGFYSLKPSKKCCMLRNQQVAYIPQKWNAAAMEDQVHHLCRKPGARKPFRYCSHRDSATHTVKDPQMKIRFNTAHRLNVEQLYSGADKPNNLTSLLAWMRVSTDQQRNSTEITTKYIL